MSAAASLPIDVRLMNWTAAVLLLGCYAFIGWDILWRALVNIRHGEIFDENFLMAIATVGAIALGEFSEGVAVMLFYQLGEWFQSYAVGRSRHSIAALMDIRPQVAHVERAGRACVHAPARRRGAFPRPHAGW